MADTRQNAGYLSIGEVLGLLLEEFPDVTISKIRFLESQGLISPERTPSGYRKFYDDDVQLLRVILAEQRQNYLPLRVIKDRLETGEIDPTGEHLRPADATNGTVLPDDDVMAPVPSTSVAAHPAARHRATSHGSPTTPLADHVGAPSQPDPHTAATASESAATRPTAPEPAATQAPPEPVAGSAVAEPGADQPADDQTPAAQLMPGVLLDRAELCAMVGMTDDELSQLESFGVLSSRDSTGIEVYGDDAVEIAGPACEFLRAGVDARHLRNWRTSAERETMLYEQLVAPRFRQRNPDARAGALEQLRRLDRLGGQLRAAMTKHALRHHFEG